MPLVARAKRVGLKKVIMKSSGAAVIKQTEEELQHLVAILSVGASVSFVFSLNVL